MPVTSFAIIDVEKKRFVTDSAIGVLTMDVAQPYRGLTWSKLMKTMVRTSVPIFDSRALRSGVLVLQNDKSSSVKADPTWWDGPFTEPSVSPIVSISTLESDDCVVVKESYVSTGCCPPS